MQASVALKHGKLLSVPVISSGALSFALLHIPIDDQPSISIFGVATPTGRDPFDMVESGRHRSMGDWVRKSAERGAPPNGVTTGRLGDSEAGGGPTSVS